MWHLCRFSSHCCSKAFNSDKLWGRKRMNETIAHDIAFAKSLHCIEKVKKKQTKKTKMWSSSTSFIHTWTGSSAALIISTNIQTCFWFMQNVKATIISIFVHVPADERDVHTRAAKKKRKRKQQQYRPYYQNACYLNVETGYLRYSTEIWCCTVFFFSLLFYSCIWSKYAVHAFRSFQM